MAMQYDVKASKPLTATGAFVDQNNNNLSRARIKAIYAVCSTAAGGAYGTVTNTTSTVLFYG